MAKSWLRFRTLLLLSLLFQTTASSVQDVIEGSYIVQFDTEASESHQRQQSLGSWVQSHHDAFHGHLRRRSVAYEVSEEFKSPHVFSGVTVRLESSADAAYLKSAPHVKAVYPNFRHASLSSQKAVVVDNAKLRSNFISPHKQTGVDKVHAQGNFGKGVKIGVIDSGIDYRHPALGGCFGPKCRISFGYDFVGDNYDGEENTAVADKDPFTDCDGHGTHVTGVITARDEQTGFVGVAPDALIGHYKVFGCLNKGTPGPTDSILLAAIIRAVETDKVDILNLSLGGARGWIRPSASNQALRNAISKRGTLVTIAVGNDGTAGAFYADEPATVPGAVAVASVQSEGWPAFYAKLTIDSKTTNLKYAAVQPLNITSSLSIKDATASDGCAELPSSTDFHNSVALLSAGGECENDVKLRNVLARGGRVVLFRAAQGASAEPFNRTIESIVGVKAGGVTFDDAASIIRSLEGKKAVLIKFPQSGITALPNLRFGGQISITSTYGPVFTLEAAGSPVLSAPGGNILSTFPIKMGSWSVESGTSQASPYVAGSAALYLHSRGNTAANRAILPSIFSTTSNPVENQFAKLLDTVVHQGGGLLNITNAIARTTLVKPAILTLNDTQYLRKDHTFTVTNSGKSAITYKIGHLPAGSTLALNLRGTSFQNTLTLNATSASIKFNTTSVTIQPGKSATIKATFTPPTDLPTVRLPLYSGYITLNSSSDGLRLPYFGVAAKMNDIGIIYRLTTTLPNLKDGSGTQQAPGTSKTYTLADDDRPVITYALLSGTSQLSVEVIRVTGGASKRGGFEVMPHGSPASHKLARRQLPATSTIIGVVPGVGDTFLPRAFRPLGPDFQRSFAWAGDFERNGVNGQVPNGSYQLRIKALKIFGNPRNESSFDTWLSPTIRVARA